MSGSGRLEIENQDSANAKEAADKEEAKQKKYANMQRFAEIYAAVRQAQLERQGVQGWLPWNYERLDDPNKKHKHPPDATVKLEAINSQWSFLEPGTYTSKFGADYGKVFHVELGKDRSVIPLSISDNGAADANSAEYKEAFGRAIDFAVLHEGAFTFNIHLPAADEEDYEEFNRQQLLSQIALHAERGLSIDYPEDTKKFLNSLSTEERTKFYKMRDDLLPNQEKNLVWANLGNADSLQREAHELADMKKLGELDTIPTVLVNPNDAQLKDAFLDKIYGQPHATVTDDSKKLDAINTEIDAILKRKDNVTEKRTRLTVGYNTQMELLKDPESLVRAGNIQLPLATKMRRMFGLEKEPTAKDIVDQIQKTNIATKAEKNELARELANENADEAKRLEFLQAEHQAIVAKLKAAAPVPGVTPLTPAQKQAALDKADTIKERLDKVDTAVKDEKTAIADVQAVNKERSDATFYDPYKQQAETRAAATPKAKL